MKQRLLKLMVVASCLSFLFSWQLTAGAVDPGRIPDRDVYAVQQDVTEGELSFSPDPDKITYSRVSEYDNLGMDNSYITIYGFTSEKAVRIQIKEKSDTLNLEFFDNNGGDGEILALDENNGIWVPDNYLNVFDNSVSFQFNKHSSSGNLVYSIEVYPSKDLNNTPLLSSGDLTVYYIPESEYPKITLDKNSLKGDLNTDMPLRLTLDPGKFAGTSVRLNFMIRQSPKPKVVLSGNDLVNDNSYNDLIYSYVDFQNFQNTVYDLNVRCEENVNSTIEIQMYTSDNIFLTGSGINLVSPSNYSQSDIQALKDIAEANPNSTDLRNFIEKGYYKENWTHDSGHNVGVQWTYDSEMRVRMFYARDMERRIDTLDLSALTSLTNVEINYTNIRKLDLSTLSNLNAVHVYSTNMNWGDVTFPINPSEGFRCYGFSRIDAKGATPVDDYNAYAFKGTEIDLSEYAEFQGQKSVYEWFKVADEEPYETETTMPAGDGEGKFILDGTPGEMYKCRITNPSQGGWSLETQRIKVSRSTDSYSQQDIDGLKKLAADNPQVPQLQEFVDSEGWLHENWNSWQDNIRTDWSSGETARLTHLLIELDWGQEPDTISKLDLSAFTELKYFECERFMNISELDLSKNTKLETLHVYSRNLETIDVSMCPNLSVFKFFTESIGESSSEYGGTKLKSINFTGCNQLKTLKIEHAHLSSLSLGSYQNLTSLWINNCQGLPANSLDNYVSSLNELSLAQTTQFQNLLNNLPSSIRILDLEDTEYTLPPKSVTANLIRLGLPGNIEEFDLAGYPNLQELSVGHYKSTLRYSQIKNYKNIRYSGISFIELISPSHPENPGRFENGDTIDLSSEAVINGVETVFMWINTKYNIEEKNALVPVEGRPGVFVLNSTEPGDCGYRCKVMNPQFCEITDINYYDGWSLDAAYIYVENSKPSEFHQGDVETIARIVAESNNADLTEWWNNNIWQTGENYKVAQAIWNNETPRRLINLYMYYMQDSFAEYVDLRSLDKLEHVSFANSFVKKIDLPDNKSSLKALMLAGSWIQSLDVSSYTSLEHLDVSKTSLQTLDVSKNLALKELKLNGTLLEGVEKTAPEIAEQLTLYGVPSNTESIDLADFPKLVSLLPQMSNLRFSGVKNPRQMEEILMETKYPIYYGSVRGGLTPYGETLSFAEEMSVDGQPSTILWRYSDVLTGIYTDLGTSESYTLTEEVGAGDFLNTELTNPLFPGWVLSFGTIVYTCDGDANLDKKVNVADVTATVSRILKDSENMILPFGFYEADVNYDDIVDVADVTGIVNIIQNRPVTKTSGLKDAYQPTVLLEVDDNGFLTMSSEVPVAGIQLEFTGATEKLPLLGEAGRFAQGSTLNGDTLRMVAYSMDGKTLPSGKRVIMKMADGLKLTGASFSDADAASLKAEGDIVPTSTEAVKPQTQVEVVRNYPNPFSGSTTFSYSLSADAKKVSIEIFNATGAMVSVIEGMPAGAGLNKYTTTVQLPSGVYYYRLSIDGENGKTVSPANVMRIR